LRFLHLSDLHLGKRVCEFSMLEDQRYILEEILTLLDETPVDGVLLAGDLYDKPVPPAEAVRLLDWFLTQLAARKLPVFAISGNHDSADRVAFGSALLADSRVYVSPVFTGAPQPIPLQDAHGTVDVYLLPFLKPAMVRHVWPDEPIESYNDALACVLRHCTPDPGHRSVLVAHQFVAGGGAPAAGGTPGRPSLGRALPPARAKNPRWAGWTAWTPPCLMPLTMWRWGICTARRRWGGRPCATAARR